MAIVTAPMSQTLNARSLQDDLDRHILAARGANDAIWDWRVTEGVVHLSARWGEMLGTRGGEAVVAPETWLSRFHADDSAVLRAALDLLAAGHVDRVERDVRIEHASGAELWVMVRGAALAGQDGRARRISGTVTDITARKRMEEQVLKDAFIDGLTNLPNRAVLLDRIGQAMDRRRRPDDGQFAVVVIALDRLATVVESLGPAIGDHVLCTVAQRLDQARRVGDTVARLGPDQFGVLMDGNADATSAITATERLTAVIGEPIPLPGAGTVAVTASAGIAMSNTGYTSPADMLRDAGLAKLRARAGGSGRIEVFDEALRERALSRLRTESDLRAGLDRGELRLQYQPIVRLSDGGIAGFEALVRWHHPERGAVPPSEFVPLAEETGLILRIGRWALMEASRAIARWRAEFDRDLFMSINVSGRQLHEDDPVALVDRVLEETGVTPDAIKLEITESLLHHDPDHCANLMHAIRARGVRLSLDDFGTGFSSLSYLHRYPIDTLKIDRSFVRATGSGDRRAEIARIITMLAAALDLDVVAEGIESEIEAAFLRGLHCHYGQGYFFSPPLAPEAVADLLARG